MQSRHLHVTAVALGLTIALVVFLLALDGGAFSLQTRSVLAIGVWWTILLATLLGLVPERAPWPVLATAGLLAAFAVWTGLSMGWAPSAENAFLELARVVLYLGVFVLAAAVGLSGHRRAAAAGLAVGVVGVGALALISRFAPDVVSPGPLGETVASARSRLSFPVDYWNGLAMLVALAAPLLLSFATTARSPVLRAAAVAPLPAVAAVGYLASSRGGFLVAVVGLLLFLLLADDRWGAALAAVVGAAGAAGAIAVLSARPTLVEEPLTRAGRAEAGTAGLLVVAIGALTGAAYALLRAVPLRRRPPAALGWGILAAAGALTFAVVAAAEPAERVRDFTRAPTSSPSTLEGHLLNLSSTGRWQQWGAAVDQFRSEPLHGEGAGSWGSWWLQHGDLRGFVREAHSLYLEVLGELGFVGLALLATALAIALAAGVAGSLRGGDDVAGVTAAAGAFLAGAAIDWMWELTVVSVVGIACLGLAAAAAPWKGLPISGRPGRSALAVAAAAALALEMIPLVVDTKLRESERAAARGDIGEAIAAADAAATIAPWTASPRLQLALVSEQAGALAQAQGHLAEALERDSGDWRLWLVAARLRVKQADVAGAEEALRNARRLNPRSPLLTPSP